MHRLISEFYYAKPRTELKTFRNTDTLKAYLEAGDIEKWMLDSGNPRHNVYAHMLVGNKFIPVHMKPAEISVAALAALETFAFVGISEDFERVLGMMMYLFGPTVTDHASSVSSGHLRSKGLSCGCRSSASQRRNSSATVPLIGNNQMAPKRDNILSSEAWARVEKLNEIDMKIYRRGKVLLLLL